MLGVSPIADLIEEAQNRFLDETGVPLTQGDIARRSGISRQRISQYATEPIKAVPSNDTVEALARGLRVSYDLVLQRFLEAAGYDVPDRFPEAARRGRSKKALGQDEQGI